MQRKVLEAIQYQKAHLFLPVEEGAEPEPLPAQALRLDKGLLLVRSEEARDELTEGRSVELGVPNDDALIVVYGIVHQALASQSGGILLALDVEEVATIDRRKESRLRGSFETVFTPLRHEGESFDVGAGRGRARTTDISTNGAQIATEFRLPVRLECRLEIQLPQGRAEVDGRIVSELGSDGDQRYRYGVQFLEVDQITEQRIRQFELESLHRARRRMQATRGARNAGRRGRLNLGRERRGFRRRER